jgi:hypothetical protein
LHGAQAITSPLTWSVRGGNYRGQGVWVRYTNGSQFSGISEAATHPAALRVSPASLTFLAVRNGSLPPASTLHVMQDCATVDWQADVDASWLQVQADESTIKVNVDQSGLGSGLYSGTITISTVGNSTIQPVSVPVQLIVVDKMLPVYLPFIHR